MIAVGEVKSVVDKATLFDALSKVSSAKRLRRFSERTQDSPGLPPAASFRHYGASGSYAATMGDKYDQEKKFRDQVFGFIICKSFAHSADAVLDNLVEFQALNGSKNMPNFIIALEQGFVQHAALPAMQLQHSSMTANAFAFVPDKERAFTFLVHELRRHSREGRSVPLCALDRYMASLAGPLPSSRIRAYA